MLNSYEKNLGNRVAILGLVWLLSLTAANQVNGQNTKALPNSKKELEQAADHFAMEFYLGKEATEDVFLREAPKHGVIHLATHSVIDDENPMNSHLLLGKGEKHDGTLHTHEIYDLDLNARLTVLSSCNSGVGKHESGEGVMSLAHAFAYAGCPSIVMSLWEVDDKATAPLMAGFYKQLAQNQPLDQAMRQAKLEYVKTHTKQQAAPFYWAAFNTWGNVKPLAMAAQPKTISARWWVLSASLVFFLWLLFMRLMKRK